MTAIQLASRLGRVAESASIAVADRARTLQSQGRRIINLAAGEPDFATPDPINAAAREAIELGMTKYTKVDGTDALKAAIARKLKRDNGLDYPPEAISVSSGGKQVIFNALMAVIDPGDEVIVPAPYWVSYPEMVLVADGTPKIVPCSMAAGFKLTPEALRGALNDRTRMLLLNSPSNPTGAIYTREELLALGEVLRQWPRTLIVSDDIYEYIRWNDAPFDNLATACPDLRDRVLVVNGVSKSHAMTGWRIGYAAGPLSLIAAMRTMQSHSTSNPNSIAQHAAATAMELDSAAVAPMVAAFKERHDYVVDRLNSIPGIECRPADGAFYAFPDVAGLMGRVGAADDVELARRLIEEAGVATVPGSAYGLSGHLRISFAASLDDLGAALDAVAAMAPGHR